MSTQRKQELVNGVLTTVMVIEYSEQERRDEERALRAGRPRDTFKDGVTGAYRPKTIIDEDA
jgi:hypothetical protein